MSIEESFSYSFAEDVTPHQTPQVTPHPSQKA